MSESFLQTVASTDRIAWILVHFLWQGTAVAAALWLLLRLVPQAASSVRYTVACCAMLMLAMCPVVTGLVRPGQADEQPRSAAAAAAIAAMPGDGGPRLVADALVTNAATRPRAADVPLPATTVSISPESPSPWDRVKLVVDRFSIQLSIAWLAGVVFFSLRLAVALWKVRRLARSGVAVTDGELSSTFAQLQSRLRMSHRARLLKSAAISVPTVIGWLNPVVLLPLVAVSGLSRAQLEALLAHELAHVKRHDYLVNLLQSVVETLLFYHPAVWWVSNRIRDEREHCCDAIALSLVNDRELYARSLLQIAEAAQATPEMALTASGGSLSERVRRVLRTERPGNLPNANASIIFVIVSGMCITVIAWRAAVATVQSRAQDDSDNAGAVVELQLRNIRTLPSVEDQLAMLLRLTQQTSIENPAPFIHEAVRILDTAELNQFHNDSGQTPDFRRDYAYFDIAVNAANAGQTDHAHRIAEKIETAFFRSWALAEVAVAAHKRGHGNVAIRMLRQAEIAAFEIPEPTADDLDDTLPAIFDDRTVVFLSIVTGWARIKNFAEAERVVAAVERAAPGKHFEVLALSGIGAEVARTDDSVFFDDFVTQTSKRLDLNGRQSFLSSLWGCRVDWLIETDKFDEAVEVLDREDVVNEDFVRICLVRAMCRKGLAGRAMVAADQIKAKQHRAIARIFVARLFHQIGDIPRATSMLNEYVEMLQQTTGARDFNPTNELKILVAETQALFNDAAAAMKTAELLWNYAGSSHFGNVSELYDLPFTSFTPMAWKESAWLMISRAQLKNGNIDDAIQSVRMLVSRKRDSGVDELRNAFILNTLRTHGFELIARHLVNAGRPERVEQLIQEEPAAIVRATMRSVLIAHTTSSDDTRKPVQDSTVGEVLNAPNTDDELNTEPETSVDPRPVTFIIAKHVILREGREIVDWADVETILWKAAEKRQIQPTFYLANGGLPRDRELREHRQKVYKALYDAKKAGGISLGHLSPRAGERYARIQQPEDLVPDESRRLEGTVLTTDRQAADGVEVFLLPKEHINGVSLQDGRIRNPLEEHLAVTDSHGKFVIYPEDDEELIVAVHPNGFAIATLDAFRESENRIQLRWWSRVSGDRPTEGEDAKQGVNFTCHPVPGISFTIYETPIAADGSFEQKYIPPGTVTVQRSIEIGQGTSIALPVETVDLDPRESHTVKLGPIPESAKAHIDLTKIHIDRLRQRNQE